MKLFVPRFARHRLPFLALAFTVALTLPKARAGALEASSGANGDRFGYSVNSDGGGIDFVGAPGVSGSTGAAYIFRDTGTVTGTATPDLTLTASDAGSLAKFGSSVSVSGNSGLVGAPGGNAAYLYRNLDTATGTETQAVKLVGTSGNFGAAVSLSGDTAVVGDYLTGGSAGAAFVYQNLDTAAGTVGASATLIDGNASANSYFGYAVSVDGGTALVSAVEAATSHGYVYLYQGVDTATGNVAQSARLSASDSGGIVFGSAVSQSNDIALIGADGLNTYAGGAYVFRHLSTDSGNVNQDAKLIATDRAASDFFGSGVSISGNTGLVGAYGHKVGANASQGAVYLYRNLDTVTGTATQDVEITASDGKAGDEFGLSESLNGDDFVIGSFHGTGSGTNTGKAYTGSVSSMTTLDDGDASRTIDGLSFVSQDDWIIGDTTTDNQVTLAAGNSATVSASGKVVSIGQTAGSNDNLLEIGGQLTATQVQIGSTAGNSGNILKLDSTATLSLGHILLADGNLLEIEGDYTNTDNLLSYLGAGVLEAWMGGAWTTVTDANAAQTISSQFDGDFTTIQDVPEPSTFALIGLGLLTLGGLAKRRPRVANAAR